VEEYTSRNKLAITLSISPHPSLQVPSPFFEAEMMQQSEGLGRVFPSLGYAPVGAARSSELGLCQEVYARRQGQDHGDVAGEERVTRQVTRQVTRRQQERGRRWRILADTVSWRRRLPTRQKGSITGVKWRRTESPLLWFDSPRLHHLKRLGFQAFLFSVVASFRKNFRCLQVSAGT